MSWEVSKCNAFYFWLFRKLTKNVETTPCTLKYNYTLCTQSVTEGQIRVQPDAATPAASCLCFLSTSYRMQHN